MDIRKLLQTRAKKHKIPVFKSCSTATDYLEKN